MLKSSHFYLCGFWYLLKSRGFQLCGFWYQLKSSHFYQHGFWYLLKSSSFQLFCIWYLLKSHDQQLCGFWYLLKSYSFQLCDFWYLQNSIKNRITWYSRTGLAVLLVADWLYTYYLTALEPLQAKNLAHSKCVIIGLKGHIVTFLRLLSRHSFGLSSCSFNPVSPNDATDICGKELRKAKLDHALRD